jgi:hypothetical protein
MLVPQRPDPSRGAKIAIRGLILHACWWVKSGCVFTGDGCQAVGDVVAVKGVVADVIGGRGEAVVPVVFVG